MAVTINDVARIAQVSITTVSKVINNNPTISEKTTKRVKEVIEKLNYTPNLRAKSFASKKTMRIAFVTHTKANQAFINPHFFEVMVGCQRYLYKNQYHMEFIGLRKNELELNVKYIIDSRSVDGMVVHASALTQDIAKYLVKTNFPHVVIGMPDFKTNVCWIDNNNEFSGQLAARHLIDINRKRIAFLAGSKNDLISKMRLDGVEKELLDHNLMIRPNYLLHTESTYESSSEAVKKLMSLEPIPDAIICANNTIDLACIDTLKKLGIHIPDQIAVITFDDYPYATITNPTSSSINIDVYHLGEQAAHFLLEKIKRPNYQFQTYVTMPLLVTRQSTDT